MHSSYSISSEEIDVDQINFILQELTGKAILLEHDIFNQIKENQKYSPGNKLKNDYLLELKKLADNLQSINKHYFMQIKLNKLSSYDTIKRTPEYLIYSNVITNLATVIYQDIIQQPSLEHSLFAIERWIYLLKISFERNDYITCNCIQNVLSTKKIDLLMKKTSSTGQAIFAHVLYIMESTGTFYELMKDKSNTSSVILPPIDTLLTVYESLEEKFSKDNVEKINKQAQYNNFYMNMQKNLNHQSRHNQEFIFLHHLVKSGNEKIVNPNEERKKIKKFMKKSKNIKRIPNKFIEILYSTYDNYYPTLFKLNRQILKLYDMEVSPATGNLQGQIYNLLTNKNTTYVNKQEQLKLKMSDPTLANDMQFRLLLTEIQTTLCNIIFCETEFVRREKAMVIPEKDVFISLSSKRRNNTVVPSQRKMSKIELSEADKNRMDDMVPNHKAELPNNPGTNSDSGNIGFSRGSSSGQVDAAQDLRKQTISLQPLMSCEEGVSGNPSGFFKHEKKKPEIRITNKLQLT